MSAFDYGTPHRWFAWRPRFTRDRGWRWLRFVQRRRCYKGMGLPGAPAAWFVYCVEEWDL